MKITGWVVCGKGAGVIFGPFKTAEEAGNYLKAFCDHFSKPQIRPLSEPWEIPAEKEKQ